ncbi:glycoside hydrolase family 13 protein [Flavobacterium turcicum]|uniref:Glycoside hydrolase family 13 protein n=1 Tax=Flavobacterium turcicum TaxID=2764718 RepID=A0ABR7JH11_9FLAO|nr:glycoside hydrolase family 13 protein [Flavobacterium turcicum]MBC5863793.1 glycoside hydrolase family 13 protein [Flavobacterium turcicum]NHL02259.1 glycoside hydrolase family 13 protein [Flavobacterium turcicum]
MKKLIVFLLFMTSIANAQIEKVEPPCWYAGMQHSAVQILFYGKDINQYQVSASNNIAITDIKKTENPNYLFVTIDTKQVAATDFVFTFKQKGKKTLQQPYSLKNRKAQSAERKGFDSSDVMYLLMPDRFANGNKNNDSTSDTKEKYNRELPGGRHGGDIEGIIKNLDYIAATGATTVWSTPLCEDNDAKFSYHTYGQSDVYKIDPRYGTNQDYARLAAELHKRKMKLVMDYVTNHWGIEHWMIKDLPTKDWINQFEKYTQTNHKRTVIHDINASEIDKKVAIDGWFVPSMPDLNLKNPLTLNYLIQNAIWWIEFADLDGLRVDTYNYSDPAGIATWTKAITNEYPNFNIVGEVWMQSQAQMAFWQKDSKIAAIQNYDSNLPSVMDFTLYEATTKAFNEDDTGWDKGVMRFYDNFANDFLYPNPNNILVFAENHDTNRINETYKNDLRKYKMAMSILATVRGIPQIYYGSEIGMAGNKDKGDAAIRQDFPGGWEGDTNNAFTNAGRTAEQKQYFDFTAKLFNWRKTQTAIHTGNMTHYIPENNIYVYFRYNADDTVMVLMNNSNDKKTIGTDRFKENIKNFKSGKEVITEQTFDITKEVTLEPKSVLILELR